MKRHRENLFTQTERNTRELAGRVARSLAKQFNERQWATFAALHAEVDVVEVSEAPNYSNRDCGLTPYESRYSVESINY